MLALLALALLFSPTNTLRFTSVTVAAPPSTQKFLISALDLKPCPSIAKLNNRSQKSTKSSDSDESDDSSSPSSAFSRDNVRISFVNAPSSSTTSSTSLPPSPSVVSLSIGGLSFSPPPPPINVYGSTTLTFDDCSATGPLPPLAPGLTFDHIVGNVRSLSSASDRIRSLWPSALPPLSKFASFTAAEVGTPRSGLNSDVLNPEETSVLLPLNEPVDATEKSQVSTFLDYMGEESVQHVAFKVDDVVEEVERMRGEGVEFLDPPPDRYYEKAREVAGGRITDERWEDVMRLGILVDVETSSVGEGMLMQIFTKP
eukprot:CAMPEP_0182456722 /NCGR_PEP_ID=MMETSP1319-20130603/2494_1 /TAXON_ID=172717 /ORGANISM="Bolidomonas pacifica, Strain RCC208" /LENGTH=313 /DNA_ID=CAMNT_0024655037 /DNA_START=109 /DNA_END=1046 /DNA_ORIENTATION=-